MTAYQRTWSPPKVFLVSCQSGDPKIAKIHLNISTFQLVTCKPPPSHSLHIVSTAEEQMKPISWRVKTMRMEKMKSRMRIRIWEPKEKTFISCVSTSTAQCQFFFSFCSSEFSVIVTDHQAHYCSLLSLLSLLSWCARTRKCSQRAESPTPHSLSLSLTVFQLKSDCKVSLQFYCVSSPSSELTA